MQRRKDRMNGHAVLDSITSVSSLIHIELVSKDFTILNTQHVYKIGCVSLNWYRRSSLSQQSTAAPIIKLAAIDLKMWYVFAAFLLVSVGASRYDQGPQRFYDVSYDSMASEQNENKEVIVYLTPDQVKALEADGTVIRSAEEPENEDPDFGFEAQAQDNNEQEESLEQEENLEPEQKQEPQQEEPENLEEEQDQDIDFDEILRILNEEVAEEERTEQVTEEEQAINEPQIEEENTESPRNFSPKLTLSQKLKAQEEKYLAPALAKKEQTLKSYSLIRYQPNEQTRNGNIQLFQQQIAEPIEAEETSEEPQTEAPAQERRKYKLIPYEVIETQDSEQNAEKLAQQISDEARKETEAKAQRKIRLESIIRELKASSKYNDQKYAIEIERLRATLEKQRAENVAKTAPGLIKQQLNKKNNLNKPKQDKAAQEGEAKPQQLKFQKYSLPSANTRPIPVPVMKLEKFQRPIAVPVETSKRVSVKNVYVRTRTDKPFIITRRVPENKRQSSVEVPTSKPERITILRHIWEQR